MSSAHRAESMIRDPLSPRTPDGAEAAGYAPGAVTLVQTLHFVDSADVPGGGLYRHGQGLAATPVGEALPPRTYGERTGFPCSGRALA